MTAHKRDQLEALFHVAMYRHRGAAKKISRQRMFRGPARSPTCRK